MPEWMLGTMDAEHSLSSSGGVRVTLNGEYDVDGPWVFRSDRWFLEDKDMIWTENSRLREGCAGIALGVGCVADIQKSMTAFESPEFILT